MSDAELRRQRILLELYKHLKAIAETLVNLEEGCQPFLSLGEGIDLNHADTFLELTNLITREIAYIKLLAQGSKQDLRDYRKTLERHSAESSLSENPELESIQKNLAEINHRLKKSPSSPLQKLEAKFSVATLRIMSLVNAESRRLGHNFIGSEQLLLGILEEGTNRAAVYFLSIGLNPEVLKERIETRIGRGAEAVASEIPHTPNVRRILALANDYTQNNSTIEPEHLMLGILDLGESVAIELLRDLAVDTEALRSHLIEAIAETKPSPKLDSVRRYKLENADLFSEIIRITALPQENGRWVCSLSGIDSVRPVLIYANTKQSAIALALRKLATTLELS
jgi:Clp amino terminal domain, pathogenicity island component